MGKWYYHNKKIVYTVLLVLCILLATIYIICVIYKNATSRRRVYEDYSLGEPLNYKGARITFKDYEVYSSGEEFMSAYDLEFYEVNAMSLDEGCNTFVVGYEIEKMEENATGPDWTEVYMYSLETSNPIDVSMVGLNEDFKPFSLMEVGEKQYVKMVCYMYDVNLIKKHRNNLEEMKMHLYFPDYEGHEYITRVNLN